MTERNFRDVVEAAQEKMRRYATDPGDPDQLAGYIYEELRDMGLAIHKESSCIRLPAPVGRVMTTEELILVGLDPVGGD